MGKPSDALGPEPIHNDASTNADKLSKTPNTNPSAASSAQRVSEPISTNADQRSEGQVEISDRQPTFSDVGDERSTTCTSVDMHPDSSGVEHAGSFRGSWTALEPQGPAIEHLEEFLSKIVDVNAGRCSSQLTITSTDPRRRCMYSMMCRCKTRAGRTTDVLFFPNQADYDKHYKMCSRALLHGYIVQINQAIPAADFRDPTTGLVLRIPSYVTMDVSLAVDEALASLGPTHRAAAVTGIAVHLLTGLSILHKRDIVHGSITRSNIVRLMSGKGTWAFRELCRYAKKGREIPPENALTHQEVLMLAPEAAETRYAKLHPAMDIWQLGVLLYELHSGRSYWPENITTEQALRSLAAKGGMPHEADPTMLQAIVRRDSTLQRQVDVIARMLSRNPADRPTAAEAKSDLDNAVYQQTLCGNEAAHVLVQGAVML